MVPWSGCAGGRWAAGETASRWTYSKLQNGAELLFSRFGLSGFSCSPKVAVIPHQLQGKHQHVSLYMTCVCAALHVSHVQHAELLLGFILDAVCHVLLNSPDLEQ